MQRKHAAAGVFLLQNLPAVRGFWDLLGKPRTAGRCKHAAAAACLLQNRTQLGGRTSSLSACTMLLCFNADNSYCGIPYFFYVLSLPIISCRRRPKHLSISLLPASSTSNFSFCMKSLTNFGQFMELLSKPWRSSARPHATALLLWQSFHHDANPEFLRNLTLLEGINNGSAVNCGAVQHWKQRKQRKRFGHIYASFVVFFGKCGQTLPTRKGQVDDQNKW